MSSAIDDQEQQRNLLFMANPTLWTVWPYLPLVRRPGKDGEDYDCGLLCDLQGWLGHSGFRCTIFLSLCGTPHKQSYADWLIRLTFLAVLWRSIGFSGHSLGRWALWTPHNKQCSCRQTTCGRV
jgi:hypothetical protein